MKTLILLMVNMLLFAEIIPVREEPQEVIYGRKDGMALTMQVLTPAARANGKGIIFVVSGGWRSSYDNLPVYIKDSKSLLEGGYTVFLVMHSSVPRFSILDVVPDIHRAVRFIRYHAKDYRIDPNAIGITGNSAGGHLSLLIATTPDKPDSTDKDPINRVSSRVQAVACLFPPTDFLNFGQKGFNPFTDKELLRRYNRTASFDFRVWNETDRKYLPITDPDKVKEILKELSPVNQVSSDDPPVCIIHGDADKSVPLQQSEWIIGKLKAANVACELRVKKGADHGWPDEAKDRSVFNDWFDKHLR